MKSIACSIRPSDQRFYTTDRQIDQLVYELYGFTDAEIKIVEAAEA